jgi:hypothetical protein
MEVNECLMQIPYRLIVRIGEKGEYIIVWVCREKFQWEERK